MHTYPSILNKFHNRIIWGGPSQEIKSMEAVVFELRVRTDRQTDRQTDPNAIYSHSLLGARVVQISSENIDRYSKAFDGMSKRPNSRNFYRFLSTHTVYKWKYTLWIPSWHPPVDVDVTCLTDTMTPVLRLGVHRRVPVAVVEDDRVSTGQVDPDATRARWQDEDKDSLVCVEAVHQKLQVTQYYSIVCRHCNAQSYSIVCRHCNTQSYSIVCRHCNADLVITQSIMAPRIVATTG